MQAFQILTVKVFRFYRVLSCRFAGRRPGDAGFADGEQVPGRRKLGLQEARTAHHHQGQAAGDPQDGVLADTETDEAHPGAVGQGDRSAHESHTGTWRLYIVIQLCGDHTQCHTGKWGPYTGHKGAWGPYTESYRYVGTIHITILQELSCFHGNPKVSTALTEASNGHSS